MRIAAVDLGTNTCLLLVAEVADDGTIIPLHDEQRLPRLGRSVDHTGVIHADALPRIAAVLSEFTEIASSYGVHHLHVCATSALRDARNAPEFVHTVKAATGVSIEIISGEEEALLTFKGAVSGLPPSREDFMVLDIGGGSTEISYPTPGTRNGSTKLEQYSLQIGAVRLTERMFKHSPPSAPELSSARALILEELAPVRNPGFEHFSAVGVAGTATTLACLDQGLRAFDARRVSGYVLSYERVAEWLGRLSRLSASEIAALSEATEGREDILTAGVLILHEIMAIYRLRALKVSERGLRYGIALREWARR
jgi:exopolyphosphatase/guanosine-5'-triphosphate,3'-diphosphate pyrophosphatase